MVGSFRYECHELIGNWPGMGVHVGPENAIIVFMAHSEPLSRRKVKTLFAPVKRLFYNSRNDGFKKGSSGRTPGGLNRCRAFALPYPVKKGRN